MFEDIIGQDRAKLAIQDWYLHEKQPLLIYGSSGFGKTMFAEQMGARTIDTTQFRGDRLSTILKPIKEALTLGVVFVVHAFAEFLKKILLLLSKIFRYLNNNFNKLVTLAA
mgnify:CR=1 FL=1